MPAVFSHDMGVPESPVEMPVRRAFPPQKKPAVTYHIGSRVKLCRGEVIWEGAVGRNSAATKDITLMLKLGWIKGEMIIL